MFQNKLYDDPPNKEKDTAKRVADFSNIFDLNYTEDEDLSEGQNNVLSKMDASKKRLGDVAPFLIDNPEKPEMDEEKRKNYKSLVGAGALGQFVDAVSQIALGRANKDYRPVPINASDLAFTAFGKVAEMDADHKQKLDRYNDQVFRTGVANKQTEGNAIQYNKERDVQIANTKMQFEEFNKRSADLKAEATKKATSEAEAKSNEAYVDAGLRLISQGEESVAMKMFEQAGLDVKDVNDMLGKSPDSPKGSTQTVDISKTYGVEWTKIDETMFKRYHELKESVNEKDYRADGSASSAKAKELEGLKSSLGNKVYIPKEDVFGSPETETGTKETKKGKDNASLVKEAEGLYQEFFNGKAKNNEETQALLAKIYENGEKQGLSKEEVQQGLEEYSNPESDYNRNRFLNMQFEGVKPLSDARNKEDLKRYASEITNRFFKTNDQEEKSMLLYQLGLNLEEAGLSDTEIDNTIQKLIKGHTSASIEAGNFANGAFLNQDDKSEVGFQGLERVNDQLAQGGTPVSEKPTPIQGGGQTTVEGDPVLNSDLLLKYNNGEMSIEQIREQAPMLAGLIEKGKGLAPAHKIEDFFKQFGIAREGMNKKRKAFYENQIEK